MDNDYLLHTLDPNSWSLSSYTPYEPPILSNPLLPTNTDIFTPIDPWTGLPYSEGESPPSVSNPEQDVETSLSTFKITSDPITVVSEDSWYGYVVTDPASQVFGSSEFSVIDGPSFLFFGSSSERLTPYNYLNGYPTNDDVGEHDIKIRATYGNYSTDQSFTLVVENVNDPPVLNSTQVDDLGWIEGIEDQVLTINLEVADPDGDDTFVWELELPDWLAFDENQQVISGSLDTGSSKALLNTTIDYLKVEVFDEEGGSDSINATLFITHVNDLPEFISEPPVTANVHSKYSYKLDAADEESTQLTFDVVEGPSWIDIRNGILWGTPKVDDVGEHQVVLSVTDTDGGVALQNFSVTVTNPEGIGAYEDVSIIETNSKFLLPHEAILGLHHWEFPNNVVYYSLRDNNSTLPETYDQYRDTTFLYPFEEWLAGYVRLAFDEVEKYTQLNFIEVVDQFDREDLDPSGTLYLGLIDAATSPNPDPFAFAFYPNPDSGVSSGEVWINYREDRWGESLSAPRSHDFFALIHEIGHALGLRHPFTGISTASGSLIEGSIAAPETDNYAHTVMSYTSIGQGEGENPGFNGLEEKSTEESASPSTYMLHDVLALQQLYGANTETNLGDDLYQFSDHDPPWSLIFDNGGYDTLDLSLMTGGSALNLAPNTISEIGKEDLFFNGQKSEGMMRQSPGIVSIAEPTTIEKVLLPAGINQLKLGINDTSVFGEDTESCGVVLSGASRSAFVSSGSQWSYRLSENLPKWSDGYYARFENTTDTDFQSSIHLGGKYLRHDIAINGNSLVDSVIGTDMDDAIFAADFATQPNADWFEMTKYEQSLRLLNVEKVITGEGNDLVDFTTGLEETDTVNTLIDTGAGDDIVWLNNGDYDVDLGDGNNQLVIQNGEATVTAGNGANILRILGSDLNITLNGFGSDDVIYVYHDIEVVGIDQSVQVVEIA